ncbi:MAG TPA: AlkA N-terminal domain-containing protein [Acidimicrobiales bacterium]|nr:AlkA N-terminal domain-containing protein [Acidimicrobiales bacterium]
MIEDFDRCYRAVQSKDPRFDGWFFTAVTSTGIYCRPSCPAMTPRRSNVRFYPTAAAAQQAGFRACKRCRPDAAPGSPEWDARADVVARAMRLIADGVVDREGVPGLAAALGYSTRQVERLLQAELGAGPVAVARAQRAQTARVLIEASELGMADVAFAAGFSSVRQFNDTVRAVFATTPTELRRRAGERSARRPVPGEHGNAGVSATHAIDLRLPFRRPLCPDSLFGHLAATSVPGVEEVRNGSYRRTLRLPHGPGIVALRPQPDHVACRLALADLRDLTTAVARCRRLLDLDADPEAVEEVLSADPALEALVQKAPGRRVPRAMDEAEMAARAVVGQQVSTASARTHAARLVTAHGTPVDDAGGGLTHLFPEPAAIAEAGAAALAGPARRRATLVALAGAIASGVLDLGPGCDRDRARAALGEIPGLGPWTVEIIAMRALGDPDAFPAGDLGVRRGSAALGVADAPAALTARARAWSPWRAYAVQYLWSVLDHPINRFDQEVA